MGNKSAGDALQREHLRAHGGALDDQWVKHDGNPGPSVEATENVGGKSTSRVRYNSSQMYNDAGKAG